MPRWRERVRLEDGLKLDLNTLIRQNLVRPRAAWGSTIIWSYRYSGEQIASGQVTADMSNASGGWFRIQLGTLDQRISLDAVPRHFGGQQWYFLCPRTWRPVSVLWKPPGARNFASRQAWGRQVAYGSQFETRHDRALSRAQDIRYRLGGPDHVSVIDGITPPKPKGMHRRTYETKLKRLEIYEGQCFHYLEGFLAHLKK
jgi:hypothetical protein